QQVIRVGRLHGDLSDPACAIPICHLGLQSLFKLLPKGAVTVLVDDDLGVVQQWLYMLTHIANGGFIEFFRALESLTVKPSLVYHNARVPEIIMPDSFEKLATD